MKVIELLAKIANGEETHFDTKLNDKSVSVRYYNDRNFSSSTDPEMLTIADIIKSLNDEVEIIKEDKKDEEIEIYANGKKVDITDIYEPLKQGEYIYKENGKWYVHKLKNVSFVIEEEKKIPEKSILDVDSDANGSYDTVIINGAEYQISRVERYILGKINEIIDYIMEDK